MSGSPGLLGYNKYTSILKKTNKSSKNRHAMYWENSISIMSKLEF